MEAKKRRWWLWNPDGNKIPRKKNQDSENPEEKKKTKRNKKIERETCDPLPKERKKEPDPGSITALQTSA